MLDRLNAALRTSPPRTAERRFIHQTNVEKSASIEVMAFVRLRQSCHLGVIGRDDDLIRAAGHLCIVLGDLGQF